MFKDSVSDKRKFWGYVAILLVSGFAIFVLGALFYTPFKELAIALNSKESVPLSVWFTSATFALLFGSIWLGFYILFESAKKGIVDLIHKK